MLATTLISFAGAGATRFVAIVPRTPVEGAVAVVAEHAGCARFDVIDFIVAAISRSKTIVSPDPPATPIFTGKASGADLSSLHIFTVSEGRYVFAQFDALIGVQLLEHFLHHIVHFAPVEIVFLLLLLTPRFHLPFPNLFLQLALKQSYLGVQLIEPITFIDFVSKFLFCPHLFL